MESVYEGILADRLGLRGLRVQRQIPFERMAPVHAKQLLTYLRLTNRSLGLLMNFGADVFRDGVKRVANNH